MSFDPNHIARTVSICCDPSKLQPMIDKVVIVKAWESTCHLTGVPSHVKELVDLQALRVETSKLADTIFTKVMGGLEEYFYTCRIGGGDLTEARIREMIALASKVNVDSLMERVTETMESLKTAFQDASTGNGICPASRRVLTPADAITYEIQTNSDGELTRLPSDFQFPKGSSYECWIQWNVGNSERQIPPLRKLKMWTIVMCYE
jgi:hypothetical protein